MKFLKSLQPLIHWLFPTIDEYFQYIGNLHDGYQHNDKTIIRWNRTILQYLQLESLRFLLLYMIPLTYDQRLAMFDMLIVLKTTIEFELLVMMAIVAMY